MPVDADENGKVDNPQTRKTQPSVAKAPHAYLRTEKANVEQQLETKLRPKLGNKLLKFKGTGFTLDSDTESLKHDNDEHNLAQPRPACTQSGADVYHVELHTPPKLKAKTARGLVLTELGQGAVDHELLLKK